MRTCHPAWCRRRRRTTRGRRSLPGAGKSLRGAQVNDHDYGCCGAQGIQDIGDLLEHASVTRTRDRKRRVATPVGRLGYGGPYELEPSRCVRAHYTNKCGRPRSSGFVAAPSCASVFDIDRVRKKAVATAYNGLDDWLSDRTSKITHVRSKEALAHHDRAPDRISELRVRDEPPRILRKVAKNREWLGSEANLSLPLPEPFLREVQPERRGRLHRRFARATGP
jgi:hypothetical protein